MAFVLDDIIESALGPWGLAVGAGVATIAALRRRRAAPSEMGEYGSRRHVLSPMAAAAGAGAGRLRRAVGGVRCPRDRVNPLGGVTQAWGDLYREARDEFDSQHAAGSSAIAARPEDVSRRDASDNPSVTNRAGLADRPETVDGDSAPATSPKVPHQSNGGAGRSRAPVARRSGVDLRSLCDHRAARRPDGSRADQRGDGQRLACHTGTPGSAIGCWSRSTRRRRIRPTAERRANRGAQFQFR